MNQIDAIAIERLGQQLVTCVRCPSASTADQGTPPRCMWSEVMPDAIQGVVVVGLNPGKASPEEIGFYEKCGLTYEATVEYLKAESRSIPYFIEMRRFVKSAMGKCHIHWTEVVKCQLRSGESTVPLDMRRICIELHLKQELNLLPKEWPVIAAGRVAFEAMSVLCTDRAVLGVPHPTGAFGRQFSGLFNAADLLKEPRQIATEALREKRAVWLIAGAA